jgi:serine/threonine protein kinase
LVAQDRVRSEASSPVKAHSRQRCERADYASIAPIVASETRDADGQPLQLVHRDLSPRNVLVSFDGVVRVTDFGVAKALGNSAETATGVLKGNLGYLAPEQVRFEEPDHRADLFALGVVLFEMLAEIRPWIGLLNTVGWIGATDAEVESRHRWITGEPFSFTAFAPAEPDDSDGRSDCLVIGRDGRWYDRSCGARYPFVCEVE